MVRYFFMSGVFRPAGRNTPDKRGKTQVIVSRTAVSGKHTTSFGSGQTRAHAGMRARITIMLMSYITTKRRRFAIREY